MTKAEATTIAEIAETILPETDTLGAKSLQLEEFIDLMLKEYFGGFEQLQFKKNKVAFEEECQFFIGKNFITATPEERQKFLVIHEKKGIANQQKTGEKGWFNKVKELVLIGYFTSEYAITELMNFNPIPTKFEGCVDIEDTPKIQIGIEGRSA